MTRSTNCSQLVPADYQVQPAHFRRTIVRHREVNSYALSNIANMDQTMVCFDSAPKCTNNIRGMKSICIATTGAEKRGFTMSSIPRLCSCHCQHKWMDDEGGTPVVDTGHLDEAEDGERRLLVLDHYKPHRATDTGSLIRSLDTDLVFIPAGCTSIYLPMDVSVNASFKKKIIDFWVEWRRQPAARTAAGNLKQPTQQHVINWISTSWEELAYDIIKKSFLRCGISNALDGSQDDEIHTEIPAELDDEEPEDLQDSDDVDALDPLTDDEDMD